MQNLKSVKIISSLKYENVQFRNKKRYKIALRHQKLCFNIFPFYNNDDKIYYS